MLNIKVKDNSVSLRMHHTMKEAFILNCKTKWGSVSSHNHINSVGKQPGVIYRPDDSYIVAETCSPSIYNKTDIAQHREV